MGFCCVGLYPDCGLFGPLPHLPGFPVITTVHADPGVGKLFRTMQNLENIVSQTNKGQTTQTMLGHA